MKIRPVYMLVASVVAVNAATVFLAWHKTHRRPNARATSGGPVPTFYRYGDKAPPLRLVTITGQQLDNRSLRGSTVLLEFFDAQSDDDLGQISYMDAVTRPYRAKGLQVIAVSRSPLRNVVELAGGLSVPVVVDDSLWIHELFHFRDCCGGTVLIDTAGTIRFISAYLAPGSVMRQVLEGYFADASKTAVPEEGR